MENRPGIPRLPDEAVVIRAGIMLPEDLIGNAQLHNDEFGHYALSCHSITGRTAQQIARCTRYPNAQVSASLVGKIRENGYDVVPDGGRCGHSNIRLRTEPTEEGQEELDELTVEVEAVAALFGRRMKNPARPKRPRRAR